MAQANTERHIAGKFPPDTKGYVFRDNARAYRNGTYQMFLDYVHSLKDAYGCSVSYVVGSRKGPTYKQNGKKIDCYDSYIIAYLKFGRYASDRIVFYTVKKYVDRKLHLAKPTNRDGIFYPEMKKKYSPYRRM